MKITSQWARSHEYGYTSPILNNTSAIFVMLLRYHDWVKRCICWTTSHVAEGKSQSTSSPFKGSSVLPADGYPSSRWGISVCLSVMGYVPCWNPTGNELCRKLNHLWKRKAEKWGTRDCMSFEILCVWRRWGCLSCIVRLYGFSVPLPRMCFPSFLTLLFSFYRCLLHCNFVILVESHRHHSGELPSPLRPEVPEAKVFSPKLFKAHILGLLFLHTRDEYCTWLRDKNHVVVTIMNTSDICIRIM